MLPHKELNNNFVSQLGTFEFRDNSGTAEYRKSGADTWSPFRYSTCEIIGTHRKNQGQQTEITLTKNYKMLVLSSSDARANSLGIYLNNVLIPANYFNYPIGGSNQGAIVVFNNFSTGDVLKLIPSGGGETFGYIVGIN